MDFRGEFKNLPPLNQDYFRYLNAQNPGTFLNLNSPLFGGLQQQLQEQFVNPNQVNVPTSSTNSYNNDDSQRKRSIKCSEPKKRVKIEHEGPPANWRTLYDNIVEMRKEIVAPVDTMGCFKTADDSHGPKMYRYQVMISLMLSSQTKDEKTAEAMKRLKEFGLTPQKMAESEVEVLQQLIRSVGFWKKKAVYLKNASHIVHTQHDGDIPRTFEGLTSLPGIGPKMAHLCMEFAWNTLTGISVDTHVHRICQRLGWTPMGLKEPEQTRKYLESWFPREEWGRINLLMVGFGQVRCLPTKPRCFECANKGICLYALNNPDLVTQTRPRPSPRKQNVEPKMEGALKADPGQVMGAELPKPVVKHEMAGQATASVPQAMLYNHLDW